jgi:hypothetical protein
MDVRDCLKHPFKIECPAELVELEGGDRWDFKFDNGYKVYCVQLPDNTWYITILPKEGLKFTQSYTLHDRDNAITELLEKVAQSIWASVQGDPVFMRRVNGWFTIFWIAMIPVSMMTGWISSVTYVAALSLWALVSGHWSAWQAARVEVHQQEDANVSEVLEAVKELPHEST